MTDAGQFCRNCGHAVSPADRFCSSCGQADPAGQTSLPGPPPPPKSPSGVPAAPDQASQPAGTPVNLQHPAVRGAVIFVAGLIVSYVGWRPLGAPAGLISSLVPDSFCGSSGYATGSFPMYLCAARVGLLNLIGPIVISVVLVFLRRPISNLNRRFRPKVPSRWAFLISPLLATGFFTMAYSGIHWETAARGGILPKQAFPALVGVIAYAVPFGVRALNKAKPAVFDRRDRVPVVLRVVLALLIPLALSFFWTNTPLDVSDPVVKEQVVILLASALGIFAFIPRSGSLRGMAQSATYQAASRIRRRRHT